jgi:hypothetical protein
VIVSQDAAGAKTWPMPSLLRGRRSSASFDRTADLSEFPIVLAPRRSYRDCIIAIRRHGLVGGASRSQQPGHASLSFARRFRCWMKSAFSASISRLSAMGNIWTSILAACRFRTPWP